MNDGDKNLHLSPLLDKIRDYGPGDDAEHEQEDAAGVPEPGLSRSPAREAAEPTPQPERSATPAGDVPVESAAAPTSSPPATAKSSKLAIYSLLLLWLLTLGGGFGAFVWQQTRIDSLMLELRDERGRARDLAAAAEREANRLSDRASELESTVFELQAALTDAQNEAAALAIASTATAPEEQSLPEKSEVLPAPATPKPVEPVTDPEPATAEQPVTSDTLRPEPTASSLEDAAAVEGTAAGEWYLNLSTYSSEAVAQTWLANLAGAPDRAEIIAVQSGGRTLYRVRIGGYASREDAMAAADSLGVGDAWASKD